MPTYLWFGTEESQLQFEKAEMQLAALELRGPEAMQAALMAYGGKMVDGQAFFGEPYTLTDGVAVIDVNGSLVNGSAGWLRIFGAIGYDDVKMAIQAALEDGNAKSILLRFKSGGGAATGAPDMGDFIMAADKVKPVVAYADETMASAAYWMGLSARYVATNVLASVGSVGTAMIHTDVSKALADQGITKTVFRSGRYKMLGQPFEPLTEDTKAFFNDQVQASADMFLEFAAGRRNVTPKEFDKTMGQGRVFLGAQALDAGLVDAVMKPQEVLAYAKSLDKGTLRNNNPRNPQKEPNMKFAKLALVSLIASAAAGKAPAEVVAGLAMDKPETFNTGAVPDAAGLAEATADATELAAAVATQVQTAVQPVKTQLEAASAKVVTLEGEVSTLRAATNGLNTELAALKAQTAKAEAVMLASCKSMTVALGGKAEAVGALTGAALVAEHDRLEGEFNKKFPGGSIAAVSTTAPKDTSAPTINPMLAMLAKSAPAA